jgi:hypothetical protein
MKGYSLGARSYLLKFNKSKELVTFVQHKKPGGRRVLIKGIEGEN